VVTPFGQGDQLTAQCFRAAGFASSTDALRMEQLFCFGPDGLSRRLDRVDINDHANVAHYTDQYKTCTT
jgi:hypothetical protein